MPFGVMPTVLVLARLVDSTQVNLERQDVFGFATQGKSEAHVIIPSDCGASKNLRGNDTDSARLWIFLRPRSPGLLNGGVPELC